MIEQETKHGKNFFQTAVSRGLGLLLAPLRLLVGIPVLLLFAWVLRDWERLKERASNGSAEAATHLGDVHYAPNHRTDNMDTLHYYRLAARNGDKQLRAIHDRVEQMRKSGPEGEMNADLIEVHLYAKSRGQPMADFYIKEFNRGERIITYAEFEESWRLKRVVEQLRQAFDLEKDGPFMVQINGVSHEFQYRIRGYGAPNGTVVDEDWEKIRPVADELVAMGYGYSCFSIDEIADEYIDGFQDNIQMIGARTKTSQ